MSRVGAAKTAGGRWPHPPMLATAAARLPEGPGWTYEVKWDGYRLLAVKDGAAVRLQSRNMKDVTRTYAPVAEAVRTVRAQTAVLDGELVAIDAGGRPSFQALHHASLLPGAVLAYYAFDLLWQDGEELMTRPLAERRAALAAAVGGSSVLLSEPLPGSLAHIEAAVRGLGLEGIVAKRADSRYHPGRRSPDWIKVKFAQRQEFVIGGFKPAGALFDSVLVGYYADGVLRYAGKVRAGFTPRTRAAVWSVLAGTGRATCPFAGLPSVRTSHWGEGIAPAEMGQIRWVTPRTVVEVAFTEWTRDGSLRHAAFLGLRPDKPPHGVHREPA